MRDPQGGGRRCGPGSSRSASASSTFLPAAFFFPWFAIAAILWLGLAGHAVPAVMAERLGPVAALRRTVELARADYVHAAGSFATLALLFGLTRLALGLPPLEPGGRDAVRVSIFLADLVRLAAPLPRRARSSTSISPRGSGSTARSARRLRDAAFGRAAK